MPVIVAPAVWALVAGSAAEASYAWYDPDFFTQGIWSNAALDKRVEVLNNYWQNLWRAGGKRVDPSSVAGRHIAQYMQGWEDFRHRYNDAIFARAADPFGLWGAKSDFESEINDVWLPRFNQTMQEIIVADPLVQKGLEQRNVDVDAYMAQSGLNPDGTSKGSNTGLYVGVAVTVVLIGIGAAIAVRR